MKLSVRGKKNSKDKSINPRSYEGYKIPFSLNKLELRYVCLEHITLVGDLNGR